MVNFSLQKINNQYQIICRGIGHGVGFSQYGGNALAERGRDWKEMSLLSLGGVALSSSGGEGKRLPAALKNYLDQMPGTGQIILHLDNDEAGRLATKQIMEALEERYEVIDDPAPRGKDFNDFLCMEKGILIKGQTEREGREER